MNFYKRFVGDYMRDTAHLSLIEHGAYTVLLDTLYATGKPLPADLGALYRICRATNGSERKAVESVATQFFPVNGDGSRHNKRADEEIEKHEKQAATNRELGKRGGRPKKTESNNETKTESVSKDEPNNNPSHSQNHKTQKSKPSSGKPDYPPGFLRFWTAWPKTDRKQGKGVCFEIWGRKNLEDQSDIIVAHVEKLAKSEGWVTGFDPMPETYLRGQRWDGAELEATATLLGECQWNKNGNRDPYGGKCTASAVVMKNDVPYCRDHGNRIQ